MKGALKRLATEGILHGRVVKNFSRRMSETVGQLCRMPARRYFCRVAILASEAEGVVIFSIEEYNIHPLILLPKESLERQSRF